MKPWLQGVHPLYSTDLGAVFVGDTLSLLTHLDTQSIDIIICTIPPLVRLTALPATARRKDISAEGFTPFASAFARVLKPRGSLVLVCSGAWTPGRPTRSIDHILLLLELCRPREEGGPGWLLAEELFWEDPAGSPNLMSEEESAALRHGRFRASVQCIWWLCQDPYVKADNRRVLKPYSESQKRLMRTGSKRQRRPSGHVISTHFAKDNGGAIPPNMIFGGEAAVAELMIGLCTEVGDVILAPMAQSNTVGDVAERMGRNWITLQSTTRTREHPPEDAALRIR